MESSYILLKLMVATLSSQATRKFALRAYSTTLCPRVIVPRSSCRHDSADRAGKRRTIADETGESMNVAVV
jgi:hypothetical protein